MPSDSQDFLNALPAGHRLHEYVIQSVLGMGGFGITYLAHDSNLNMQVAVKEYLPASLAVRVGNSTVHPKSVGEAETYWWGLSRFLMEAQTLARFRHPNIVRVLRFFEENGTAYMVMEYEEGQSLPAHLRAKHAALDEQTLLKLLLPLLDGLKRVHAQNFMHRDIKPSNVFVRQDGTPVLLDFGSARLAVGSKAQHLTTVYTPGYAPFEQYFSDGKQGPWTDIYAMGAILYWCVTGAKPVDAASRVKKDTMVSASTAGNGRFSASFLHAIDEALTINEEARPQSVDAWQNMLGVAGRVEPSAAPQVLTAPAAAAITVSKVGVADRATQMDLAPTKTTLLKHEPSQTRSRAVVVALALVVLTLAIALGVRHRNKIAAEHTAMQTPAAQPTTVPSPNQAATPMPTNAPTLPQSLETTATRSILQNGDEVTKKIAQRFAKADTNGDGYLSHEEARREFPFLAKHFQHFDSDGDGRWSLAEVTNALNNKQKFIQENRAEAAVNRR